MESPMPGIVLQVLVKEGDTVKRGQKVLILEAMKMENEILAEYSGEVQQIMVKEGDAVQAGAPILEIV
jgi:biotin carboxyl carrier protein